MGVFRKLRDSIFRRGVVGTLRYINAAAQEWVRWRLDSWYDIVHHVDTSGKVAVADLGVFGNNAELAIWYEPVPTSCFRQLVRMLPIRHDEFIFIDFGSGKGRALLLASDYPFARIIGVEFSPELHDIALHNIKTYRSRRQRCRKIESVCIDAAEFALPVLPAVLFFYSPFKASLLHGILEKIKESLRNHPRQIYILFIGVIPESIQVLQNCGLHCQEVCLFRDRLRGLHKRGFILCQNCNASLGST